MDYEEMLLNRLLDKYEKSTHFKGEAAVNRRILLKCDEGTLGLDFSEYCVCEDFKRAVIDLADRGYIQFDWKRKDCIINQVWLLTNNIDEIYHCIKRSDMRSVINMILLEIQSSANTVHTEWILKFLQSSYQHISVKHALTGVWNNSTKLIFDLLKTLREIDNLNGKEISMRAFSVSLFSDSKYFERNIKAMLLPIIYKYEPSVSEAEEISDRDALAQAGIIMMPEIFEFCGQISIVFFGGTTDFSAISKGACISSNCVADIKAIQIKSAKRILFIENKTNYSEYVLNEYSGDELVIYHGGFYSPAKAIFFKKLFQYSNNIPFFFWGDIDLGGFKMFNRLKENIIPNLIPLNMDISSYLRYSCCGVEKNDAYIEKIGALLKESQYYLFYDVIECIVEKRVIVEQESFLTDKHYYLCENE